LTRQAQTLDIKPGNVVLDPMCGSGALLLEALLFWPHARYIGLDIHPAQVCPKLGTPYLLVRFYTFAACALAYTIAY